MLGGPGAGRFRLRAACRHGSLGDCSCQAWAARRERAGGVVPLRLSRAVRRRWAACTGDAGLCSARSRDAAGHGDLHALDRECCVLIGRPGIRVRWRLRPATSHAAAGCSRSGEARGGGRRCGIGDDAGDGLPCLLSSGGIGRQNARAGGSRRPVSGGLRGCCIHRWDVGSFAERCRRSGLRHASREHGVTGPVQPGQAGRPRQGRRSGEGSVVRPACRAFRSQRVLVRPRRQLAAVHLCRRGRLAWHGARRRTRRNGDAGRKRACGRRAGQGWAWQRRGVCGRGQRAAPHRSLRLSRSGRRTCLTAPSSGEHAREILPGAGQRTPWRAAARGGAVNGEGVCGRA